MVTACQVPGIKETIHLRSCHSEKGKDPFPIRFHGPKPSVPYVNITAALRRTRSVSAVRCTATTTMFSSPTHGPTLTVNCLIWPGSKRIGGNLSTITAAANIEIVPYDDDGSSIFRVVTSAS